MGHDVLLNPDKSQIRKILSHVFPESSRWYCVSEDDLTMKRLTGGYCNTILRIDRRVGTEEDHESDEEPQSLVLRLFGNETNGLRGADPEELSGDLFRNSVAEETLIVKQLSGLGLGPKVCLI